MHAESHRIRFAILIAILTLMALLFARPSHGAWGTAPIEVRATRARIPAVAAAPDERGGVLVVWQETTTAPLGKLFATRVDANGSPDLTWPQPLLLAADGPERSGLLCASDRQGGTYVMWMEGAQIFLSRIAGYGAVAPGWPATGIALGFISRRAPVPQMESDGRGGVWLAWVGSPLPNAVPRRQLTHLGPEGAPALGWTRATLTLPDYAAEAVVPTGFQIARRDDGDLWLAWSTLVRDTADENLGSLEYRLSRLRFDGGFLKGWTSQGIIVGGCSRRLSELAGRGMRPFAIATTPDGGIAMSLSRAVEDSWENRLEVHRFSDKGAPVLGWRFEGARLPGAFDAYAPQSLSPLLAVPREGGLVYGGGGLGTESSAWYSVGGQPLQDNAFLPSLGLGASDEFHVVGGVGGAIAMGTASPFAWHMGPAGAIAGISASFTAADGRTASFTEVRPDEIWVTWFAGSNVAVLSDEDAVFVWAQERERFGLFAKRLSVASPILGADVPVARPEVSARFERGAGVLLEARFPDSGETSALLLDVQGRRIASVPRSVGNLARQALPGTGALPAGLYFVRVTHRGGTHIRKVVVAR